MYPHPLGKSKPSTHPNHAVRCFFNRGGAGCPNPNLDQRVNLEVGHECSLTTRYGSCWSGCCEDTRSRYGKKGEKFRQRRTQRERQEIPVEQDYLEAHEKYENSIPVSIIQRLPATPCPRHVEANSRLLWTCSASSERQRTAKDLCTLLLVITTSPIPSPCGTNGVRVPVLFPRRWRL